MCVCRQQAAQTWAEGLLQHIGVAATRETAKTSKRKLDDDDCKTPKSKLDPVSLKQQELLTLTTPRLARDVNDNHNDVSAPQTFEALAPIASAGSGGGGGNGAGGNGNIGERKGGVAGVGDDLADFSFKVKLWMNAASSSLVGAVPDIGVGAGACVGAGAGVEEQGGVTGADEKVELARKFLRGVKKMRLGALSGTDGSKGDTLEPSGFRAARHCTGDSGHSIGSQSDASPGSRTAVVATDRPILILSSRGGGVRGSKKDKVTNEYANVAQDVVGAAGRGLGQGSVSASACMQQKEQAQQTRKNPHHIQTGSNWLTQVVTAAKSAAADLAHLPATPDPTPKCVTPLLTVTHLMLTPSLFP